MPYIAVDKGRQYEHEGVSWRVEFDDIPHFRPPYEYVLGETLCEVTEEELSEIAELQDKTRRYFDLWEEIAKRGKFVWHNKA